ncbi:MAG: hypothetical protein JW829_09810 [Pirellulales bacterium]|nr:hypothetical protein [Pirellulales bacterium]
MMFYRSSVLFLAVVWHWPACGAFENGQATRKYFAHAGVEDRHGVIAPWYHGQNGQCDFRIRIAAETLKRYPWAEPPTAVMAAPHFVFNGHWNILPDGTIQVHPELPDWHNGDIGQRSISLIHGLNNYYAYTGDAGVIGTIQLVADYILNYCQTPPDHAWPDFFISAPTKGKAYGQADPHGFIQLDLSAQAGSAMLVAYKLTGNKRYLQAARHWARLLAEHCDMRSGHQPWNRYANPEDVPWDGRETGGVVLILQLLEDIIRHDGPNQNPALVAARDAGERYLHDVLLPEWSRNPTFGHHFWDWLNPVGTCSVPCFVSQYMMNRREDFPNWKTDTRNILSLFFCRSSVNPESAGGVYSGAWAIPESSDCCGKSLQYPMMVTAPTLARFGQLADSEWAREVARRQCILSTYDIHETGVVEDGIDGGAPVTNAWFHLAHPWPLRQVLECVAWQPEQLGANRENHIVRCTSVVQSVHYRRGQIAYSTYDSPSPCEDVLRLAFEPKSISADGKPLSCVEVLSNNGFTVQPLSNGDCIVRIRHDGSRDILIEGDDPQEMVEDDAMAYEGPWAVQESDKTSGGRLHVASQADARAKWTFEGNQVRLIGRFGPDGGKADVYLDGVKQLCGIDFWCPQIRDEQVLCYKNGLTQGKHSLEIIALGAKNPHSTGSQVSIDAVEWSAAEGQAGLREGGGPAEPQRVIFGYFGREDYVDSAGNSWRPATEFTYRAGKNADLVPIAFWTEPRIEDVAGTRDPELYLYGLHGNDFTVYFTVNPKQTYHVKLKFCQADQPPQPGGYATNVQIQGNLVISDMDIAATAGGLGKAVDLVFNEVQPQHGAIAIRFHHRSDGNAMIQAIEIGPGNDR